MLPTKMNLTRSDYRIITHWPQRGVCVELHDTSANGDLIDNPADPSEQALKICLSVNCESLEFHL